MKKILIASVHLDFGGIEKALINLLKNISPEEYEITLILQEKRGVFLKDVPSYVKIKTYSVATTLPVILRKLYNRMHFLFYVLSHYHQYDLAICYAPYDIPSSLFTKKVGKKSIIWIHSNYTHVYPKEDDLRQFFDTRHIEDFDQVVFVSNEAQKDLIKYYPSLENKSVAINNLLDFDEIIQKSLEPIDFEKKEKNLLFVGRLEEKSKGLLRLFLIMKNLAQKDKNIHLWVIGDGPDAAMYQTYLAKNQIDNVTLLGAKENPYPYMREADVFVLPSYYEGFPVVCLEALALQKKVVTTIDVSTGTFHLKEYAFLCEQEENSIEQTILTALKSSLKKSFDYVAFNTENKNAIASILKGEKDEI